MSFSFEFVATKVDALEIVEQEHAPLSIKAIIRQALDAFQMEDLVHVKAMGHLFNNDYVRSNADLVVEQVILRKPRVLVVPAA